MCPCTWPAWPSAVWSGGSGEGRFVDYEIADKRVIRLLDQAEDLLLGVGSLIECCPRYRRAALAHPVQSASGRKGSR